MNKLSIKKIKLKITNPIIPLGNVSFTPIRHFSLGRRSGAPQVHLRVLLAPHRCPKPGRSRHSSSLVGRLAHPCRTIRA